MTYTFDVEVEPLHETIDMNTESVEEMQFVMKEYANVKKLMDPQLISYIRYAS